ncbi:MAG: HEPN domain protein [Candidatus Bathyarchaeota archaeon BA2]|nr:MAG: HEPN domain protein [Candidatus Bathyarchaeota archaeon BA2]
MLEAERWMMQSLRDLKAAKDSLSNGNYEWACFQAQQSAEKALKALVYANGRSIWGHMIVELLGSLKDLYSVNELLDRARLLDRHYIPSRYPNVYESGYPGMFYDRKTAEEAIATCEGFMKWVKVELKKLGLSVQS